ncbi:hypothetical protein HY839_00725 [Candidatus Azambacteria bacterium]|nr:hypothetical protein [Candidatus Azambacteria bacterium]
MGRIIEIMTIGRDSAQLEVISDIGGPEEISPDSLELFFPLFRGRNVDVFHAADLRDHLREGDRGVGLCHAECLMKTQSKIPREWEEKFLFFPGTILRGVNGKNLYIPFMEYGRHGWSIRVYPIWRMDWRRHFHYFVRWKR